MRILDLKDLRKWLLLFAGGALLIGCAGGGTDVNTTNGGSNGATTGGDTRVPTVRLSGNGQLQFAVISGQGRRDIGSQIAVFRRISFQNSDTDFIPSLDQSNFPDMKCQLDNYKLNTRVFGVSIPGNANYREFVEFPFEVYSMEEVTDTGTAQLTNTFPALALTNPLATRLKIFPGRQTTLHIALDDAILLFDPAEGVVFDRDLFIEKNYDFRTNSIRSFISDMIAFDLTQMAPADRPFLNLDPDDGLAPVPADMVLFSGDSIGISAGFGTLESFELLDPIRIEKGLIQQGPVIGSSQAPGVYTLVETDPRDLSGLAKITALQGSWFPKDQVLANIPDFAMLAIPGSDDDNEQQLIAWNQNAAGQVTALWQGIVTYDGAGSGVFSLWPINQVDDGNATNEVDGVVKNLVVSTGVVVRGEFEATTGAISKFPFPKTGAFVVYRR